MFIVEIGIFQNGLKYIAGEKGWSQSTSLIICLVIFSYVYIGGFKGVLITDVLQLLIFFGALLTLGLNLDSFQFTEIDLAIKNNLSISNFIWIGIASFLVGFCWITCIPEIWIRLSTLKTIDEARKSVLFSGIGWPFAVISPLIIVFFSGIEFQIPISQDAAYHLWQIILQKSESAIITWSFVGLLVTAVFTTLDTIIMSATQLLFFMSKDNTVLRKMIGGDVRYSGIILLFLAFGIGIRLDSSTSAALGLYAGSIPIILFTLCYIQPEVSKRFNITIPNRIHILPMLFDPFVVGFVQDEFRSQEPSFHVIPIYVLLRQVVVMTICALYFVIRRRVRNEN
jgi:Na+/proline symporter